MKPSDVIGCRILVLGFLLSVTLFPMLGCRSLPQSGGHQVDDRWVCPEFADLPMRQDRFEEAIGFHLKVLDEDPMNALAYYHLGYSYGQLGARQEEIEQYLKAVDLGLRRSDLFYNLGMAYNGLGRYEQAEQAFVRAIELEPKYGENHRALGMVYYMQEHYIEAQDSCRKATFMEPNDPDSWHCLAVAAARADEVGEAWTAVKRLKKLDPDYQLDPFLLQLFPAVAK